MDLIGFIFYYLIGLVGAWTGLLTTVYILQTYIDTKGLKRDSKKNKLDKIVTSLYDWIGLDLNNIDFRTSKIKLTVALVCGIYATLGTYAFVISFILGLLSYFTIVTIQLLNHK